MKRVVECSWIVALCGIVVASGAQAQIVIQAQVTAIATTGSRSAPIVQQLPIGDPYTIYTTPTFSDSANVRAESYLVPGDLSTRQLAQAGGFAYAQVGGLRASIGATSSTGSAVTDGTGAGGSINESWSDRITFHTSRPGGADFVFSMTLDDTLSTTLSPSFIRNTGSTAAAVSYFYFSTGLGGDPLLSVVDTQDLRVPDAPVTPTTQPISIATHPAARTVTATVHVVDGEMAFISQQLYVQASVIANGSASADAADTAYLNLYSLDPDASYTTGSGTIFAASGDPFAPTAPVPEPSEWALMLAGLAGMGFVARRRRAGWIRSPRRDVRLFPEPRLERSDDRP